MRDLDIHIPKYAYEVRMWLEERYTKNVHVFRTMRKRQLYSIYFTTVRRDRGYNS